MSIRFGSWGKMATAVRKVCFQLRGLRNKIEFTNSCANYHLGGFRVFDGRKFPEVKGYDPVTDTPDWCYADGRPGHYTLEQKKKRIKQMEYAQKIELLLGEVDLAVENHARRVKEREDHVKQRYENQPKEKVPRKHVLKMKKSEIDE